MFPTRGQELGPGGRGSEDFAVLQGREKNRYHPIVANRRKIGAPESSKKVMFTGIGVFFTGRIGQPTGDIGLSAS